MAEYTDVERDMALDIYRTQGATAAARAIGCSRQSIYDWLGKAASTDESFQKAAEERAERHRMLRGILRDRLLLTAIRQVDRTLEPHTYVTKDGRSVELEEPPGWEVQKLMTAAGIAIDKYRLEMGEHTDRQQVVTLGAVEQAIAQLEAEMNVAAGD